MTAAPSVTVEPATPDRWEDVVALFDRPGDAGRCWCLYFRMPKPEWSRMSVADRRDGLAAVVAGGSEPGLLAYVEGEAVGWVSVAPREEFEPHLERTRVLRPLPGEGVWSVLCFVVRKDARRRGVASRLLGAAVEHARAHGAKTVEGHPYDERLRPPTGWDLYVGTTSMFVRAGFSEVARRGKRPTYRLEL
jgi:GNAT superfamily N-acetyltransferase